MIGLILDLFVGGVVLCALGGLLAYAALTTVAAVIASMISGLKGRTRRCGVPHLQWSRSPDDIARALTGEQAVAFSVRWRRGVRMRHLEFMLVPRSDLPELEQASHEPGWWHVFCPDLSSACTAVLPWSGLELAQRLKVPEPDNLAGAQALDAVMSRMVGLLWGAG